MYSALDTRVDYAVSVAGGVPTSRRLQYVVGNIGDYEQSTPELYSVAQHEELMLSAGTKSSLHIFNEYDGCCYQMAPNDPFVPFMQDAASKLHRDVKIWI